MPTSNAARVVKHGCFDLSDVGIIGLDDPSGLFLSGRVERSPGRVSRSRSRAAAHCSPRYKPSSRRASYRARAGRRAGSTWRTARSGGEGNDK